MSLLILEIKMLMVGLTTSKICDSKGAQTKHIRCDLDELIKTLCDSVTRVLGIPNIKDAC